MNCLSVHACAHNYVHACTRACVRACGRVTVACSCAQSVRCFVNSLTAGGRALIFCHNFAGDGQQMPGFRSDKFEFLLIFVSL